MNSQIVQLATSSGSKFNLAVYHPTGGLSAGSCLLFHCLQPKSDSETALLQSLTQGRYKVYSLNFSELNLITPGLLEASLNYIAQRKQPILLVGHSLGGSVMLTELPKSTIKIGAVALIATFPNIKFLNSALEEDKSEEEAATINLADLSLDVDPEILDELASTESWRLKVPGIIMQSPQDEVLDIEAASTLYNQFHHPKSFISLNGADHLLSQWKDARYCGKTIVSLAERYMNLPESEPLRTDMEVVTKTPANTFTTEIRAGNHTYLADEPLKVGGNDLGPTPYDLLNSALGACTSMTLQMYAARKKWPLEQALVHLKHSRVYSQDCESCEEKASRIDQLSREIELIGELTEEQRVRLMEIADKCPVHKTLEGKIDIVTNPFPVKSK
jgi:putative redox protein